MTRDHAFRNAGRPRDLLPGDVPPGRNIGDRATSRYQNQPQDLYTGQPNLVPEGTNPSRRLTEAMLLYAMQRRGNFSQIPFAYPSAAPALALALSNRLYILIQNLSTTANLYVGIGQQPSQLIGRGLKLIPGGYYEPLVCPQEDIWLQGDASGNATILYANAPQL